MFQPRLAVLPALLASLAGTHDAAAQPVVTVPKIFTDTFGAANHSAPLGRTRYFGQTWYRGDSLPSLMVMTHVAFRPPRNATYGALSLNLEIVLDNSTNQTGLLSKTFTANLSSTPTTFMKMKIVSVPAVNNNSDPSRPAAWFPGDAPMIYTGPNLLVQTDVQTSSTPSNTGFLVDGFSSARLALSTGTSCGRSTLTWSAGVTDTLTVTGAPPNAPVAFHLGLDNRTFSGGTLPFDLGVLGMTNCRLLLAPLLSVVVPADASGRASVSGTRSNPPSALMAFAQASHPETGTNPANYVATNMASTIVGTTGLGNYVYNWTTFGPSAQYGPYPTMYGHIMMFK